MNYVAYYIDEKERHWLKILAIRWMSIQEQIDELYRSGYIVMKLFKLYKDGTYKQYKGKKFFW